MVAFSFGENQKRQGDLEDILETISDNDNDDNVFQLLKNMRPP